MKETGKCSSGSCSGQLTARGIVIGGIGCVVITAASIYTALKMGALPWPIVFAALISLFFLRALGSRSLNEANVTHTIMSAGAMVAGGLAFTIPGIWILGAGEVSFFQMLLVALAGSVLGLVASALLRCRFVGEGGLEFPIGRAAAETLKAGDAGGRVGLQLFGAMGISGVIAFLRDALHAFPALLFGNVPLGGVAFGVYVSPMMMSVGFLVGTAAMVSWFCGGMIQLVLVAGAPALGLWDDALAGAFNSSLGMGVMIGCGVAVVVKDIFWKGLKKRTSHGPSGPAGAAGAGTALLRERGRRRFGFGGFWRLLWGWPDAWCWVWGRWSACWWCCSRSSRWLWRLSRQGRPASIPWRYSGLSCFSWLPW